MGWILRSVCLAALASCAASESLVCEDGSTCPGGFQCDVANHRCLRPEQLAACDGKAEDAECDLDGQHGTCRDGACEPWFCGDGHRNGNEACDGEDLGEADCITAGYYAPDGLKCSNLCTYDTTSCGGGRCGDHMVNGQELCDGDTQKTCISIGFDAGSVSCDNTCGLSIRDCSRFGWNPESLTDVIALALGGSSPQDQWAVGQDGKVMHYEGAFWNFVPVPTNTHQNLVGVWSIAVDDAWIVGQGNANPFRPSIVMHWDGVAWALVDNTPAVEYTDVWAAGKTAVFTATDHGVQTFDGTAWSKLGDLDEDLLAIRGTSATDIWVATHDGPTQHWNGTAWSELSPPNAEIHFLDANAPNDVWVMGSSANDLGEGLIAHWDGATWREWRQPGRIYNNIASSAPNDTWVAGTDGIMRHFDGEAWSESTTIGASPSGLAAISGFMSFGPGDVVAVSTLNLAYRYRGQAFGILPKLGADPFTAVPNTAIASFSADDVWITAARGQVLHYDGTDWSVAMTIPDEKQALSIAANNNHDIWVGGGDGKAYHFDGSTWTDEDVTTIGITQLWVNGAAVWAFAGATAFKRTNTGWVPHSAGSGTILAVSGTSEASLHMIETTTSGTKLFRWNVANDDMWSEVATGAMTNLLTVHVVGDNDVHVTAKDGRIHHWDGAAWHQAIVPALADLEFLASTATDDVIAASQRDLFHWDGRQWSQMRPPVDFVPNTPDYIPIAGITATPGRVDILLERFRVRTLIRTRPITCRARESACNDAVDDDCDGAIDGLDSECH